MAKLQPALVPEAVGRPSGTSWVTEIPHRVDNCLQVRRWRHPKLGRWCVPENVVTSARWVIFGIASDTRRATAFDSEGRKRFSFPRSSTFRPNGFYNDERVSSYSELRRATSYTLLRRA